MKKSGVPAKVRARQRWRKRIVQTVSTLEESHQQKILWMLHLTADPPENSEALEKLLADVELDHYEKLADRLRKRLKDPSNREARKYAEAGLRVARAGNFEQAAYCAAMMMNYLAESPLLETDVQRAVQKERQVSRRLKGAEKQRAKRQQELDKLARLWIESDGDAKRPSRAELARDAGLTPARVKDIGGKRAIEARAKALRFDDLLRKSDPPDD